MGLLTLYRKPAPALAPYFQGYLDAKRKGTYVLSDGIARLPVRIYGLGSDADAAWMEGVTDYCSDTIAKPRTSRTFPPWRLI